MKKNSYNSWLPVILPGLFILALFWVIQLNAQEASINRPLDWIIFEGRQFPDLIGTPHHDIHVYRYDLTTDTWSIIPSQVDDFDTTDRSFTGAQNGILDSLDQLVLLPGAMGDRAGRDSWVYDAEAEMNGRYEIAAQDPLTNEMGWAYLYTSSTVLDAPDTLIHFDSSRERVATNSYIMVHKDDVGVATANGFPLDLYILSGFGGSSLDLLDRFKFRLYGIVNYDLGFTVLNLETIIYEDSEKDTTFNFGVLGRVTVKLDHKPPRYGKLGPVRLIREQIIVIRTFGQLLGQVIDDSTDFPLMTQYLPNHYEISSGPNLEIPRDFGDPDLVVNVQYLRVSTDFNSNANGMYYFSNYNNETTANGAELIDGIPHSYANFDSTFTWPGLYWTTITGDQGTIFNILDTHSDLVVGGRANPFFWDNREAWPSYPPNMAPTGDGECWGDYGFELIVTENADGITGPLDFRSIFFYLEPHLDLARSNALVEQYQNPLQLTLEAQQCDTPPVQITNLAVVSVANHSVTLSWPAPTENLLSGGACERYTIRYSINPDMGNAAAWWTTASDSVIISSPSAPGTVETCQVVGLDSNTTYWFGIKARDSSNQWSNFNNNSIISRMTTPVELVHLVATTSKNQVTLEWHTTSETNNLGFDIERMAPAMALWEFIGFVKGSGTTESPQHYSYQDKVAELGQYRYRLKQLDTDGAFAYSPEIEVLVKGPENFAIAQNYPNPFNPATTFHFEVPVKIGAPVAINLAIYDIMGRKVRTLIDRQVQAGYHKIQWDGRDDGNVPVSSGVYFYVLTAENFRSSNKMIKMQ